MSNSQERLRVDSWLSILYDDLHARARLYLGREAAGVSIRPTALVHEAFLRIAKDNPEQVKDQTHLLALASVAMRHVLVDEARARNTAKRGGGWTRLSLEDVADLPAMPTVDVLAVDEILNRLAEFDQRAARVAEMKIFGGLTDAEVGASLDVTDRWARKLWSHARAWLERELDQRSHHTQ